MRSGLLALGAPLALIVLTGLMAAAPAAGGLGGKEGKAPPGPAASPAPASPMAPAAGAASGVRSVDDVDKRVAQYSPTPLSADLSALGEQERRVLGELAAAAKPLDQVFLLQAWTGNPEL